MPKTRLLYLCAIGALLTMMLLVSAAAQTTIETPWSSKATVLNLPANSNVAAVDSIGNVFFELINQQGSIGKLTPAGQVVFTTMISGLWTGSLKLVPDNAGNVFAFGFAAA